MGGIQLAVLFGPPFALKRAQPSLTIALTAAAVLLLVNALVSAWALAAVACAVAVPAAPTGEVLRASFKRLGSFLWLGFLLWLFGMSGFFFLALPGLLLTTWICLAPFILAAEGLGGLDAMARSQAYTAPRLFQALLRLWPWPIALLLSLIPVAGPVLSALALPLAMAHTAVTYHHLKEVPPAPMRQGKLFIVILGLIGWIPAVIVMLMFGGVGLIFLQQLRAGKVPLHVTAESSRPAAAESAPAAAGDLTGTIRGKPFTLEKAKASVFLELYEGAGFFPKQGVALALFEDYEKLVGKTMTYPRSEGLTPHVILKSPKAGSDIPDSETFMKDYTLTLTLEPPAAGLLPGSIVLDIPSAQTHIEGRFQAEYGKAAAAAPAAAPAPAPEPPPRPTPAPRPDLKAKPTQPVAGVIGKRPFKVAHVEAGTYLRFRDAGGTSSVALEIGEPYQTLAGRIVTDGNVRAKKGIHVTTSEGGRSAEDGYSLVLWLEKIEAGFVHGAIFLDMPSAETHLEGAFRAALPGAPKAAAGPAPAPAPPVMPDIPMAGRIDGKPFKPNYFSAGYYLHFGENQGVHPVQWVGLRLLEDYKALPGRTLVYAPDGGPGPEVHVSWIKDGKQRTSAFGSDRYSLKLAFDPPKPGRLSGSIFLDIPSIQTQVYGRFDAPVKPATPPATKAPAPPVTAPPQAPPPARVESAPVDVSAALKACDIEAGMFCNEHAEDDKAAMRCLKALPESSILPKCAAALRP